MPVMESYQHADEPHEKTVAGTDYRYGCHSSRLGPMPRGRRAVPVQAQDGWTSDGRRNVINFASDWIEMPCGHTTRARDSACEGCSNRHHMMRIGNGKAEEVESDLGA